jgi:hypothetical protein
MNLVFPLIENKDIFLDTYQGLLSKRLLGGKRLSIDAEKLVIALMKLHSGVSYTVKLEGMLNDYLFSEELHRSWTHSPSASELQVRCLSQVLLVVCFHH